MPATRAPRGVAAAPGSANGLSTCPGPRCRAHGAEAVASDAERECGRPEPGDDASAREGSRPSGTAAGSDADEANKTSLSQSSSHADHRRRGWTARRRSPRRRRRARTDRARSIQPIGLRGCRRGDQGADDARRRASASVTTSSDELVRLAAWRAPARRRTRPAQRRTRRQRRRALIARSAARATRAPAASSRCTTPRSSAPSASRSTSSRSRAPNASSVRSAS